MHLVNFAGNENRFGEFSRLHPLLQAVFFDAALYAKREFGLNWLLITSMQRPGDKGVHGTNPCRGLDVDVCNNIIYEGGLIPEHAELLVEYINRGWRYDPERAKMKVAIYGDLDPKGKHWDHIHFQVHDRTVAI